MGARETLGQQLIREGLLRSAQLQAALNAQLQFDGRLGTNLIELGFIDEEALSAALARQHRVACISSQDLVAAPKSVLLRLPGKAAANLRAVPLRFDPERNNCLRVAMADPGNLRVVDDLTVMLGCRVLPVAIAELRLGQLLEKYYGIARPARMFVRVVTDDDMDLHPGEAQGYAAIAEAKPGATRAGDGPSAVQTRDKPAAARKQAAAANHDARMLTPPPLPPARSSPALARIVSPVPPVARIVSPVPAVAEAEPHASASAEPTPATYARPALHDVLATFTARGGTTPQRMAEWWLTPSHKRKSVDASVAPVGELEFDPGELDLNAAIRLTLAPAYSLRAPAQPLDSLDGSGGEFDLSAETELVTSREFELDPAAVQIAVRNPAELGPEPRIVTARSSEHRALAPGAAATLNGDARVEEHQRSSQHAALAWARRRHSLEQVLEQLSATDDRDIAAHRVLSYLAQSFACALILVVRQGVAYGWKGFASNASEEQIESLVVPLSAPSLFQQAFDSGQPFRGAPAADGERIHARVWKLLQCERPSEVLITPVHVENRLVNLIYAHPEATRRLRPVAQSHLVQLASATGLAYRRAIRRATATPTATSNCA